MSHLENNLTITINDQIVSYIDEGQSNSTAIIFIHGFPLNKMMWSEQIGEFKKNYRVIAYDVRGHGNTPVGDEHFSIELFVNDLLSLMDALKINKAILCGFSMGGYIALNAIENYPNRFSALILCDTNCTEDKPEAKEKRMKAIESIKEKGLEQYAQESLKKLFSPLSLSKQIDKVSIVKEMIMKTSKQSIFKTLHALAERAETCTKLHEIKIPVLILVGKEDEITPPNVALSMHEKIKGSTIHIIDGAGHLSNMENPNQFNEQLEKFLKQEKDDNKKGYPSYGKSKDIYEKFEKKSEINPEDISKNKALNSTNAVRLKPLDEKHKLSGKDLDVPGSELDDAQEAIGSEDEENNYYS